jgi:hypothetical protein
MDTRLTQQPSFAKIAQPELQKLGLQDLTQSL